MKCLLLAFLLCGCGSTGPAALKPLDTGDDVDRVVALQDNYVTLIERAEDPIDAASALRDYCKQHRVTIDGILARVAERGTDAAFAAALQERAKAVIARLGKVYDARPDLAKDRTVAYALRDCDGREAVRPDMCEQLVTRMKACAEVQPPRDRELALKQVEELRSLDPAACADIYARAQRTTASVCPDVQWE